MSLTIDLARRVLEACKQRANELRSPVSIAIVDAGGHLVLVERMMAPYGWATVQISIAKATTAVMFNQSTDAVAQWGSTIPGFASSMAEMSQGKFIMAAGGWPIRLNRVTIGGIGVSGGNAPGRDDEIARAGLAIMEVQDAPVPPMRQSVQPTPVYAQPVTSSMQPSPVYPFQPAQPSNPPATSHLGIEPNAPAQEHSYDAGPAESDQYHESSNG
ncbi:MAG TPA: heme-binding protein [Ktedonosporobacter sp.]|nr:heme-binding protein [Ktedonosporobacter sp.]